MQKESIGVLERDVDGGITLQAIASGDVALCKLHSDLLCYADHRLLQRVGLDGDRNSGNLDFF